MESQTKPCGYCEKSPEICTDDEGWYYVQCSNNECLGQPSTCSYPNKEQAVDEWNAKG